MIGVTITLFTYAGHEAIPPVTTTGCMLSASLIRYADTMRCSVSADASCVPEPDEIVSLFLDEFVALAQLAGCTENLKVGRRRDESKCTQPVPV